ncbi:hypothetical protein [Aureibacter tunicatorum]|uniref:Lipocalin-like domain-containing protein n=1 Tax=Aureibacter tunicatorum TaxID=866807 RepID=A0AAE3XP56_9BACT|nr:hypothetical protein [Aureibacter tunicatorum]MDR6241506.1 hypothetical protein [Aureibacter tunicatorum]BDD07036.1 hypothetical protein AUTU_45190 [Aureibacter tunicatorum]
MKNIICSIILAFFALVFHSANAFDNTPSAAEVAAKVKGQWKLISFEKGGEKVHYENRNIVWSFDGRYLSVESDDLGGKIEGSYRLKRSVYKISPTFIILCDELDKTHLPHGKLVVGSVENDSMTLIDWNKEVEYILQRTNN